MLHLKDYIHVEEPGTALDLGSRFGEFAFSLQEIMPEGSRIIGIDCDPAAVEQAREKNEGKGLEFEVGDILQLSFEDNSVEAAALSNTLHHLEDYPKALAEMVRVVRPGGWVILNEMYSDAEDPRQITHHLQHTLEADLDMISGGYQKECWTRSELLEIFEELPLTDVVIADLEEETEMDAKLAKKSEKLEDAVRKKAEGKPEFDALLERARQIRERVRTIGIRRCPQLVYAGKKKAE